MTIALLGTFPMLSWRFQEWVRTSAEFHQQTAFCIPVAGTAATVLAVHGCRTVNPATTQGSPTRTLTVLQAALTSAYVLGLVPLVVATIATAQAGTPNLFVMLTGILGLSAAMACGCLLGLHWRSPLACVTTAALLTATTAVGMSSDTAAALIPVQYTTAGLGQPPSTPIIAYRLAFLVTLTIAAIWLTIRRVQQQPDTAHHTHRSRLFAASAIIAAFITIPTATTPALFTLDPTPPRTCTSQADLTYCVHTGHAIVLHDLTAVISGLANRYGPLSTRLDAVYDIALLGAAPDINDDRRLWFDIRPDRDPTEEAPVVADLLAGVTAMQKWIANNQDAIRSCTITTTVLPRR